MIIGETFEAPEEKTTLLRLSAKELLQNYRRRAYHLKEDGDGLVVAEGEKTLFTLPNLATGIAAVPGKIFAYAPSRAQVYMMKSGFSGYDYTYSATFEPYRIFRFYDTQGAVQYFCATQNDLLYYNAGTTTYAGAGKGGYAAVFHDRIFTAKGSRVNYSKAFDGTNWNQCRYGAGYIDLIADELGDILGMQPYKDKLYLFRKHGITSLRVLGDELNFKAVHITTQCGTLIANTVAICGDKVAYFTDRGLYLFNGAISVLAENSRYDEINLGLFCKAVTYCGRYYAYVTKKTGGTAIYCYDPEQREGYFIENGAADIASGDALYFTRGNKAYSITAKGVCNQFTPYFTAEGIAFGLSQEKTLRALAIDGEGTFSVTVTSGHVSRTVKGNADEVLKLRSPLRGNGFDLKVSVAPADADKARFRAVSFRFTEEKDDD